MQITTSEKADTSSGSGGSGSSGSGSGSAGGTNGTGTSGPASQTVAEAKVDLWDSEFPESPYYWTVVPVDVVDNAGTIEYHDEELPQDVCGAGRVVEFGKTSLPVVTGSSAPFASGLSPGGRLTAAAHSRPSFYGSPLVAWQPALGADEYEVQWSKTAYPWTPVGQQYTFATSMTLPLKPGLWYYRVRGIDFALPTSRPQMSWSSPIAVVVAKPRFRVVR
jgi:hypothetical protein